VIANSNFSAVRWIISSTVGALIALVAFLVIPFSLFSVDSIPNSILGFVMGILMGTSVGLFQWLFALRGRVYGAAWLFATALAGIILAASSQYADREHLLPQILEYYNPGCLSLSCDSYTLHETWFSGILIYGLIGGLSAALPTSIALGWSGYHSKLPMWWIGCILASVLGLLAYIPVALIPGPVFSNLLNVFCSAGILVPFATAVILAPFIKFVLRDSGTTAEAR
jgi:hypothetical protein